MPPVWHFYAACTFGDARREGYIGEGDFICSRK